MDEAGNGLMTFYRPFPFARALRDSNLPLSAGAFLRSTRPVRKLTGRFFLFVAGGILIRVSVFCREFVIRSAWHRPWYARAAFGKEFVMLRDVWCVTMGLLLAVSSVEAADKIDFS